tara:strand:- start:325 stop:1008 length:684 start_codon:yes stop_codon:yes gene_type:complete
MGWFQVLKATPVFDKDNKDMGYYDGEAKINLANFGPYKDSSDEEVIDAIMNIAIHEDAHAAFHEGNNPSKIIFDLLVQPLARIMNRFKTDSNRTKEVLYQIKYKMWKEISKFVQATMIDEVFAYRSGHLRMDEKFMNFFMESTKGKYPLKETKQGFANMASDSAKKYMTGYIPRYIRDFSKYIDGIFEDNINEEWVISYTKGELEEIRDALMRVFEETIKREISKLR